MALGVRLSLRLCSYHSLDDECLIQTAKYESQCYETNHEV